MRAAPIPPILLVALVAACQSGDRGGDIHVDPRDHVSFAVPDGFRLTRDRDAWILVGEKERAGATILIRSVARDGWSQDRSSEMVLASTEIALRAYPGASVKGPTKLDDAPYPGFAFDLTFEPRAKRGERYRRRHATLISAGHVFHVVETWPATQDETARRDYRHVLDSVREEG
jgi:hypothetical protein